MATPLADLALLTASLTPAEFRWRATGAGGGSAGTAARPDAAGDAHGAEEEAQAALLARFQAAEAAGELDGDGEDELATTWPALACAVRLCAEPDAWLLADWAASSAAEAAAHSAPRPRTVLSAPEAAREESLRLEQVLREREAERDSEDVPYPLFDLYSLLTAHLASQPLSAAGTAEPEDEAASSSSAAQQEQSSSSLSMRRDIFWTHHLKAPSKRRDLQAWAAELHVWAVVKLGYPGFLLFEGREEDVDEMSRRIKALQWHALQQRSTVRYEHTADGSSSESERLAAALRACLLAAHHPARREDGALGQARTGCEELEATSEVVKRLRTAGVPEEEIVDGLGLRVGNASSAG